MLISKQDYSSIFSPARYNKFYLSFFLPKPNHTGLNGGMLTAHSDKPKELLGLGTNSIAWISLKLSTVLSTTKSPLFLSLFFCEAPLKSLSLLHTRGIMVSCLRGACTHMMLREAVV